MHSVRLFDSMRHRLATACLVVPLFGCTVVTPEPLPPYALSDNDTMIVLRGIYSAVKDLDEPSLRNLKAARSNSGDVYVCGWVSSRTTKGYRTEQAFIGTLSAGQFSAERIAKDNYSTGEILTKCQERGLSIS